MLRMDVLESGIEPAPVQNRRQIAPPSRLPEPSARVALPGATAPAAAPPTMSSSPTRLRQLLIVGVTKDGRAFRPSDWSERLAGAMSAFRPGGAAGGIGSFIGYSPYCVPRTVDGHKCVLVNEALRGIEVLAWDFVMHFARDNELEVRDVTPPAES
jgi:Protein of unknown function (DUF3579)